MPRKPLTLPCPEEYWTEEPYVLPSGRRNVIVGHDKRRPGQMRRFRSIMRNDPQFVDVLEAYLSAGMNREKASHALGMSEQEFWRIRVIGKFGIQRIQTNNGEEAFLIDLEGFVPLSLQSLESEPGSPLWLFEPVADLLLENAKSLKENPDFRHAEEDFLLRHKWKPMARANHHYPNEFEDLTGEVGDDYRLFLRDWGIPPGLSTGLDKDFLLYGPFRTRCRNDEVRPIPLLHQMHPLVVLEPPDNQSHLMRVGFRYLEVPQYLPLVERAVCWWHGKGTRLFRGDVGRHQDPVRALTLESKNLRGPIPYVVLLDLRAHRPAVKTAVREFLRPHRRSRL